MNNQTTIFVPTVNGLEQRQGFINPSTNQTFMDPAFQTRVPVNTIVNTAGGQYRMTETGGVRQAQQTPWQMASQMTNFQGHAGNMRGLSNSALNSAIRHNNSMTEMAIQEYHNMARAVNDSAEEQARAAYIKRLRSKNKLPRLLRAQGITGGASESTTARMSSNFDNIQFGIMRDRANELFDLQSRQSAARSRGAQNEANIRQQHAMKQMNLEQDLHNQEIQRRQFDQTEFDRRRNEQIATLSQFENDYQAQINHLNENGDPYNLIPHLHILRNQKISRETTRQQEQLNQWISNVSNFPSNVIYGMLLEIGDNLEIVPRSMLQAAFNQARERERLIGNDQSAHESNMTSQELRRMIDELILPPNMRTQSQGNL